MVDAPGWQGVTKALHGFGGQPVTLTVWKTGAPYLDALRLYGAIDLYLRSGEVAIYDSGPSWKISGRETLRPGRDIELCESFRKRRAAEFCAALKNSLLCAKSLRDDINPVVRIRGDFDPILQSGLRGNTASDYKAITGPSYSIAKIPLADAVLAFAGVRYAERFGELTFIPVYEGFVDLAKAIGPLRLYPSVSSVACLQAFALLSVKCALSDERFDREFQFVYRRDADRGSYNFSASIRSYDTALSIMGREFCSNARTTLQVLLRKGWKGGKAQSLAQHAISISEWILGPTVANMRRMTTALEAMALEGLPNRFFADGDDVKRTWKLANNL